MAPGEREWSFEGLGRSRTPPGIGWSTHRFSDMHPGEALVFKTHDSEAGRAHCVPHVAFDHPDCAPDGAASRCARWRCGSSEARLVKARAPAHHPARSCAVGIRPSWSVRAFPTPLEFAGP